MTSLFVVIFELASKGSLKYWKIRLSINEWRGEAWGINKDKFPAFLHPGFGRHLHLSDSYLPGLANTPRSGDTFIYISYVPAHFSCLLLKRPNQSSPRGNPATSDRAVHSKACSSHIIWTLITPGFASSAQDNFSYLCRPCPLKCLSVPCLRVCIPHSHRDDTN